MSEVKFKFDLGTKVIIMVSEEIGEVIGRAEYVHCESSYFVRYKAADGRAAEGWWTESSMQSA